MIVVWTAVVTTEANTAPTYCIRKYHIVHDYVGDESTGRNSMGDECRGHNCMCIERASLYSHSFGHIYARNCGRARAHTHTFMHTCLIFATPMPAHVSTHMSTHTSANMPKHISSYASTHMSTRVATYGCTHVYMRVYARYIYRAISRFTFVSTDVIHIEL